MLYHAYLARKAKFRRVTVVSVLTLLLLCLILYRRQIYLPSIIARDSDGPAHPIELLHEQAIRDFRALLSRQSRSIHEATKVYKARYGRPPPPGFNKWVKFALKKKSPIIDDFDTILENIKPFFHLPPDEVTILMDDATHGNNDAVSLCSFTPSGGFESCGYFGDTMDWILGDIKGQLPSVTVPVNLLDEPSVLVTNLHDDDDDDDDSNNSNGNQGAAALDWSDLAHQSIVDRVAKACMIRGKTSTNRSRTGKIETEIEMYGLPFVQSVEEEKDLCLHPEYKDYHGFLSTPTSFRHLGAAVPVLSRAAPYPFADILMPSPHYAFPDNLYNGILDQPWHQKRNAVFWHGSTTGGHWHKDASWRQGQRQRLTMLASMSTHDRNFTYLERITNDTQPNLQTWQAYTTSELDRKLYNIHISAAMQCDPDQCEEQVKFFNIDPDKHPPPTQPYQYRFAFDIDGNSYSGRFHKHLAGHTTPLKMSIFKEWHDERLIPWLHFVPVSQSLDELPELMRFMAKTEAGQSIAHSIAEEGRKWYHEALTPMNQGLYLYRLFLELAWLQNPARIAEESEL